MRVIWRATLLTRVVWRAFWRTHLHTSKFSRLFETSFKWVVQSLCILCTKPVISDGLVLVFEIESKPLLNLLNYVFAVIENNFCGDGEDTKRQVAASIPVSLTKRRRFRNRATLLPCRCMTTLQVLFELFFKFLTLIIELTSRGAAE